MLLPLSGEIDSDVVIQADGSKNLLFEIPAEILEGGRGDGAQLRRGVGSGYLPLQAVFGVENLEAAEEKRTFELARDFPGFLTTTRFEEQRE